MAEQAVEWEEEALQMLERGGWRARPRERAKRRVEDMARQQGQSKVTAALIQELLQLASRWGWGGALTEYDPASAPDATRSQSSLGC